MDADDVCLPGRLEEQARFLDEHPSLGLVGCRVIYGGDREAALAYLHRRGYKPERGYLPAA